MTRTARGILAALAIFLTIILVSVLGVELQRFVRPEWLRIIVVPAAVGLAGALLLGLVFKKFPQNL